MANDAVLGSVVEVVSSNPTWGETISASIGISPLLSLQIKQKPMYHWIWLFSILLLVKMFRLSSIFYGNSEIIFYICNSAIGAN